MQHNLVVKQTYVQFQNYKQTNEESHIFSGIVAVHSACSCQCYFCP